MKIALAFATCAIASPMEWLYGSRNVIDQDIEGYKGSYFMNVIGIRKFYFTI